jgi:drug/metabolite transporter (DMT)-like permease
MEAYRKPLPWTLITVASFLGSYLSMMMWLYSYKLIPASVSSVLNQSANAWMVLLAWMFLHEYIGMRKIYGLVLTTGGVLIMLLA